MATLDFAISFPLVRGDSVGVGRFHSQPNRGSDLRPRRRAFEKRALAADGTQRLLRNVLHSAYENVFR